MEIRKYEVIIKAAECKNLTRAGEAFGYTQSGVSHMIRGVEEEFGFRLFLRVRDGVRLSPEGERVLPCLREMAKWNEQLGQTVSSINGLICGTLRIGAFTSISFYWLPKIIKRFQRDFPNIKIEITEGGIGQLEAALEDGAVDLAFMSVQPERGYDRHILKKDAFLAILPFGHPMAAAEAFPLEAFNGADFILLTRGFDYDTNRILQKYSLSPNIKFTSHDDHTAFSMVENGLGISILPELVMQAYRGRAAMLPLAPAIHRDLALCVRSFEEASPASRRFIEYTKKMVAPDGSVREE
ncbi:MAG: LysR family transcriptional regulator [Cloacibacillus sp.]